MKSHLPVHYCSGIKKGKETIDQELFQKKKHGTYGSLPNKWHFMLFLSLLLGLGSADAQTIRYVREGFTGNGASWANASGDLQATIDASSDGDQVWVASGTYQPIHPADNLSATDSSNKNNAFVLKNNVKVFGGFTGTETSLTQRDSTRATNNTILSGDIGQPGIATDNAYHVVIIMTLAGTTELNGFTIKDGYAHGTDPQIIVNGEGAPENMGGGIFINHSSPILANLTITGSSASWAGGGIYFANQSLPALNHLIITGNNAINYGGGIFIDQSTQCALTNSTISSNISQIYGGGIYSNAGYAFTNVIISGNNAPNGGGIYSRNTSRLIYSSLTNVVMSGNTSTSGGAIYNDFLSTVTLINVTVSGNSASNGGGIFCGAASNAFIRNSIISGNNNGIYKEDRPGDAPGMATMTYSLVQGSSDITNGNIDGNTDPEFVNPIPSGLSTSGGFHLRPTSSAIDKGNNTLTTATTDLDGNPRIVSGTIDMGAYEHQILVLPVTLVSFTAQAKGNQAELKWSTATEINNKEFIVLHSTDGSRFTEIGKVAGTDNSGVEKNFVFYDAHPVKGINFYSLQQVDYDGHKTQTGIREVNFSVAPNAINIYPNPVSDLLETTFSPNIYHQIQLTGVNGSVLKMMSLSTTDTQKKIDMSSLPSGTYFIRLVSNDKVEIRTVVKE
jgi:hypothetical protein